MREHLSEYENDISFNTEYYKGGEELVRSYEDGNRFDLIFLDIRMGKMNGIETANEIRKVDKQALIIFVTSMLEFVFQGYEVRAFNYLMKLVSKAQFEKTFMKATSEIAGRKEKIYVINTKESIVRLDLEEVIWLESQGIV